MRYLPGAALLRAALCQKVHGAKGCAACVRRIKLVWGSSAIMYYIATRLRVSSVQRDTGEGLSGLSGAAADAKGVNVVGLAAFQMKDVP
mgnify:CR=1 FL=1